MTSDCCGPRQAALMLEPASQWFSWLPHPHVASWLQPCSHQSVILKAGKWTEPLLFIPLTWKANHSQGLLSKLLFMFNWPELDHVPSLSLKQNRGNCRAHVGKREDHNRGDQCLCVSVTEVSPPLHSIHSVMMSLLTAWLAIATFPAILCQRVSKAGPWALGPTERMLPGHQTRQVQLHLNIQTRDFQRHSRARNLKNDITVWSYLVFFLNQIHKTEQMCRNTHTKMRQMHRDDSP